METPAAQIRYAMKEVQALRSRVAQSLKLSAALHDIKMIQSMRFAMTYQDLMDSKRFKGCAEFFLTELYSERDYRQRDQQFARVAGAIELAFPKSVLNTTVQLAKLHHVTETLDVAMAEKWLENGQFAYHLRYLYAWKKLNFTEQRQWQLNTVILIGRKLGYLTQQPGLRMLLKIMQKPAAVAGLAELQSFLETGFDKFKEMSKQKETLNTFLETIQCRESEWISKLNSSDEKASHIQLSQAVTELIKQKSPIE